MFRNRGREKSWYLSGVIIGSFDTAYDGNEAIFVCFSCSVSHPSCECNVNVLVTKLNSIINCQLMVDGCFLGGGGPPPPTPPPPVVAGSCSKTGNASET